MEERLRNIFDIWSDRGRTVPFKVHKIEWKRDRIVTVDRISDIKTTKSGIYGKAWTMDEWYWPEHTRRDDMPLKEGEKIIYLSGTYKWIEVIEFNLIMEASWVGRLK